MCSCCVRGVPCYGKSVLGAWLRGRIGCALAAGATAQATALAQPAQAARVRTAQKCTRTPDRDRPAARSQRGRSTRAYARRPTCDPPRARDSDAGRDGHPGLGWAGGFAGRAHRRQCAATCLECRFAMLWKRGNANFAENVPTVHPPATNLAGLRRAATGAACGPDARRPRQRLDDLRRASPGRPELCTRSDVGASAAGALGLWKLNEADTSLGHAGPRCEKRVVELSGQVYQPP